MSWFKILKENKLISQNITHTKVGENKPEVDDDRCKKRLKKFLDDLDSQIEHFTPEGVLVWKNFMPSKVGGWEFLHVPEQSCCEIIEELQKIRQGKKLFSEFRYGPQSNPPDWHDVGLLYVQELRSSVFDEMFFSLDLRRGASCRLKVHDDIIYAYDSGDATMKKHILTFLGGIWEHMHGKIVEILP
jgi:hypothetical protein